MGYRSCAAAGGGNNPPSTVYEIIEPDVNPATINPNSPQTITNSSVRTLKVQHKVGTNIVKLDFESIFVDPVPDANGYHNVYNTTIGFCRTRVFKFNTNPSPPYYDGAGCWTSELVVTWDTYSPLALQILGISDTAISPDGRKIVFRGAGEMWEFDRTNLMGGLYSIDYTLQNITPTHICLEKGLLHPEAIGYFKNVNDGGTGTYPLLSTGEMDCVPSYSADCSGVTGCSSSNGGVPIYKWLAARPGTRPR